MSLPPPIARLRRYATTALAPLWRERGWDHARGGFHERLGGDLRPLPVPYRRALVQARQLFVFSRVADWADREENLAFADGIYAYLTDRFHDRRHGGWFFSVDLEGTPVDTRKDLYAHAFVIFALAAYHRRRGTAQARELALHTLAVIEERLRQPHGGFAAAATADWQVSAGELLQNPHMHLLEACLAWIGEGDDAPFRVAAGRLVTLLLDCLCDPGTGIVLEYFDAAGRPEPERGHIAEPGHQFEWYWLLRTYMAATGDMRPAAVAEKMFAWAERHGWDPQYGGNYDEVARDGTVVSATKRIWPQLECIRAHAARAVHGGTPADLERMMQRITFFTAHYMAPNGHCFEWLMRDLRPRHDELPASTAYHLVTAIEEMQRPFTGETG